MLLLNRARMTTATTGTGTVTLGTNTTGAQTFAAAGAVDGGVYPYVLEDANGNWEFGFGTYTSSGTTFSRDTVIASSNSGSQINLSGTATIYSDAFAETFSFAVAHGDSDYTIPSIYSMVYTNAAFTSARTWTLPAAAKFRAGKRITICDLQGTITDTNTLTVSRAGSDTVDGGTSIVMKAARESVTLESDGSSKWKVVAQMIPWGTGANQLPRLDNTGQLPAAILANAGSLATDADMKNPTSASKQVSPNYQDLHPFHPKFACSWSYATAALTNTVSAVNSSTDTITSNAHGLSTGDFVQTSSGSMPAGWVASAGYFVRVIDANNFTAHPTYADAQANTNKLDLTNTTTGGGLRKITITLYAGNSIAAPGPVLPKAAIGTEAWTLNLLRSYNNIWFGAFTAYGSDGSNRMVKLGGGIGDAANQEALQSGSSITFSASGVAFPGLASGYSPQNWNTNTGVNRRWSAILYGE